jgi:hypothetical protein
MPINLFFSSLNLKLRATSDQYDLDLMLELNELINAIQILHQEAQRSSRIAATFSQAVVPGQLVAVYNVAGVLTARLASAADNTKVAVGYVSAAVAINGTGEIILNGANPYMAGLTVGAAYYLSDVTPGGVTSTKPVGVGKIVQPVGFASSVSTLITNPNNNWTQL